MSKPNLPDCTTTEETANEAESYQKQYEGLGFVGLYDDSLGEELLKRLNIPTSIFCTGFEGFKFSPEWLSRHKDWNNNVGTCMSATDKADTQAGFDEVEFSSPSSYALTLLRPGRFLH